MHTTEQPAQAANRLCNADLKSAVSPTSSRQVIDHTKNATPFQNAWKSIPIQHNQRIPNHNHPFQAPFQTLSKTAPNPSNLFRNGRSPTHPRTSPDPHLRFRKSQSSQFSRPTGPATGSDPQSQQLPQNSQPGPTRSAPVPAGPNPVLSGPKQVLPVPDPAAFSRSIRMPR
jgi:hypothetical protein